MSVKLLLDRYFIGVPGDAVLLQQHVTQIDNLLATYKKIHDLARNSADRKEQITFVHEFLHVCRYKKGIHQTVEHERVQQREHEDRIHVVQPIFQRVHRKMHRSPVTGISE